MPRPLKEKTVFARLAHMAAHGMWEEYVALVDRMGADWQATDPALPRTFVHEACQRLNLKKLAFLVKRGAPVSVRDAQGKTPLDILVNTPVDLHQADAASEFEAIDAMALLLVCHGEKLTSKVRHTAFERGLPGLARHVLDHPPRTRRATANPPLSALHLFVRGFVADDTHAGFPYSAQDGSSRRLSMLFSHLLGRANPPVPASRWETLELIMERNAFFPHELLGGFLDQVLMEGGYCHTPDEDEPTSPVKLLSGVFSGNAFSGIVSSSTFADKGDSEGLAALRARLVQYALHRALPAAGGPSGLPEVQEKGSAGHPVSPSVSRKSRL